VDPADLKSIAPFDRLSATDRRKLAQWMDLVELPVDRVLTEEGALAFEFLVITHGTVRVTQDREHVRDLGPGDYVGEIGLLNEDRRRTASVVTTSPVRAIVMAGPQFRAMVREMPALAAHIQETIRTRLTRQA
jgi:CRP/FNR family transcriptional regulator, cyclic AMP receptor protein